MAPARDIWFFAERTTYEHKGKGRTREWILRIIEGEGRRPGKINIIFCSDEALQEINIKYLKHSTLTDIVTFDLSEEEKVIEGDIYISVERARENALKFGVKPQDEIMRLIAHGILHLAGYRDKTTEDKGVMTRKEDYYLSLLSD